MRRSWIRIIGWLVLAAASPITAAAGDLSFEDRVAAQRAIEQVYWNHRIWPKENRGPKPALSAVISDEAIQHLVQDYLRKSTALETFWQRPITPSQLQAEMERMARDTRNSEMLLELFRALENDPDLIAEVLARQTLADRLIRSWYATDDRFHGGLQKAAEIALASCRQPSCLKSMGGAYHETTWGRRNEEETLRERPGVRLLEPMEWEEHLTQVASTTSAVPTTVDETPTHFVVRTVLRRSEDEVTTASVTWTKRSFDDWWRNVSEEQGVRADTTQGAFRLVTPRAAGCSDDTWSPIPSSPGSPSPRWAHAAVWTGAEMIVWGGSDLVLDLDSGSRYSPALDSWTPTSVTEAPEARRSHSAIWTGAEMIIWGGHAGVTDRLNTGGRYAVATDSWLPTSTGTNVPAGREAHTAVWTPTGMIVWGGDTGFSETNTGARYEPASDSWVPTSLGPGVPTSRSLHSAVWTGSLMIVWGGDANEPSLNSGGRYSPTTDSWFPTSTANAPSPRYNHVAVWTGMEMIIWAGNTGLEHVNTGARYDPVSDTWLPTAVGPSARARARALWTGTEMLVWGGSVVGLGGGRYNPIIDTWTPISTINGPHAAHSSAVWADTQMIVWGGLDEASTPLSSFGENPPLFPVGTGARYCACSTYYADDDGDGFGNLDAATDICDGAPPAGHVTNGADCNDANPAIHPGASDANCNNLDDNCSGAPDEGFESQSTSCGLGVCASSGTTSCVSGVVQDSCTPGPPLGPSDPSCDGGDDDCDGAADEDYVVNISGWLAITPTGAPSARERHTVTCAGTEALAWGGSGTGFPTFLNTGARYQAVTNTWVATNTGGNVPDPRRDHRTVWGNGEWIVWGGERSGGGGGSSYTDSGGRYNAGTGAWTATSTSGQVPSARALHSQVWISSQNRMAVWGGRVSGGETDTGAFFTPGGNNWVTLTATGAPAARFEHTAVFAGSQNSMLVWGGRTVSGTFHNTGGRFDVGANTWTAISTAGAPSARTRHIAIWTGTRMVVWGGWNEVTHFGDGASYDPATNTWTPLPSAGAPSPRRDHVAVWTGTKVLVWGGLGPSGPEPNGAAYDPASNTWSPLGTVGAPPATRDGAGCWLDGPGRFVVFGGATNGVPAATGGRYVPPTTCGLGACARQSVSSCSAGFENFACVPGTPQPETCNRLDEDCNGVVDDSVGGSPGTPCLMASKGGLPASTTLTWPAIAGATGYDVVRGTLGTLRSTAGNYTPSVDACLADNLAALTVNEPVDPAAGQAFWHLMRANFPGGPGTYDEAGPKQVGLRDAEIAASPGACP